MDLSTNQLAIFLPVGAVIVFALLVFAFGFKSSVEPPSFKNIDSTSDEKKNLKKKKVKDKKAQTNGHATVVIDVPDTKKDSTKTTKQTNKTETPKQKKLLDVEKPAEKKPEPLKSPSKKEKKGNEGKNRKNLIEKPADFDEGEWETQPSRKDKKKKKEDDPVKDILAAMTPEKVSKKKTGSAPQKDKPENVPLKVDDIQEAIGDTLASEPIIEDKKEEPELAAKPTEGVPVTDLITTPEAASQNITKATEMESTDEQSGKKKKNKKNKVSTSDDDGPVPEAEKQTPATTAAAPAVTSTEAESLPAFNELEETWKEAPQKKSKKKVRKD